MLVLGGGSPLSAAADLTVCTQNLWNYGLPEDVRRLRRPGTSLEKVRSDLDRQERALVERLGRCDVVAVEELVGDRDERAKAALDRLARLLRERTGRAYEARIADTRDVIRNGFLVRTGGPWSVLIFEGRHSKDPLPSLSGYPKGAWDRGPAEIVLELREPPPGADREAGASRAREEGRPGTRVRVIVAHLKSKRETEQSPDPSGERWERLRVLQARALVDLARRRLEEDPEESLLIAGDFNNGRGSAMREVLSGRLEPGALVSPDDCIDQEGRVSCPLPRKPPFLIDLADSDPDMRGRGTYRYRGREELIDGIFASPRAATMARERGASDPADFDVAVGGRLYEGSDHRRLETTLHPPAGGGRGEDGIGPEAGKAEGHGSQASAPKGRGSSAPPAGGEQPPPARPPGASGPGEVASEAPDEVVVRAGGEPRTSAAGITVRFVKVLEDSRCPVDVQCVWAGNARLALELSSKGGLPVTPVELNTLKGPRSVVFSGRAIEIERLSPAPRTGSTIAPSDYEAVIRVAAGKPSS